MNEPHGKSIISVDDEIIIVKAIGAFNDVGIEKAIEDLKLAIESFGQKKFKLLFDYIEVEGGTPDVFEKINDFNIWLNSQNMVAKALVIKSSMNLSILKSRTPARNSQNEKSFDNKNSAMSWLKIQS